MARALASPTEFESTPITNGLSAPRLRQIPRTEPARPRRGATTTSFIIASPGAIGMVRHIPPMTNSGVAASRLPTRNAGARATVASTEEIADHVDAGVDVASAHVAVAHEAAADHTDGRAEAEESGVDAGLAGRQPVLALVELDPPELQPGQQEVRQREREDGEPHRADLPQLAEHFAHRR